MVTLEPMNPEAWDAWHDSSVRGYALEKVRAGTWTADEAQARSEAEFAGLLPDGLATPGHQLRSIVTESGEVVGTLWFAPQDEIGSGECFIYDIVIHEDARGRGYGRAALAALEPLARSLGYDRIGLHVFGDNHVARELYRTSGYVETDVTMRKALG